MNEKNIDHDTQTELDTREGFEVHESPEGDLEVIELEHAPLTDINFGF